MPSSSPQPTIDPRGRATRLARLLGVSILALTGFTWRLWIPQDLFPRVPLFHGAPPRMLDWLSVGLIVAGGLTLSLWTTRWQRLGAASVAMGFGMSFLGDQLRLQPWAWQFSLLSITLAIAKGQDTIRLARWLTVSIYIYSACSKFDAVFLNSSGWEFLWPLTSDFSGSFTANCPWPRVLPIILPIYELLTAALIVFPGTRRLGLFASWLLHGSLLLLLGPLGLNHSWGVILWNVFFIVQNAILLGPHDQPSGDEQTPSAVPAEWSRLLYWAIACVGCVWPVGYPWGWCDAWLGWAVYAPPLERTRIVVAQPARLGDSRYEYLRQLGETSDPDAPSTLTLSVADWSLSTLGVPPYPSTRYQTAIALELMSEMDEQGVEFELSRRLSRARKDYPSTPSLRLTTKPELEAQAQKYWFNAIPEFLLNPVQR